MKPAAKIIARAPKPVRIPWPLVLLAVVGGVALVIWSGLDAKIKPSLPLSVAVTPTVQSAHLSAPIVRLYNSEIETDVLRGHGITVADWLQKIAGTAPARIRFSPDDLVTSLPSLRICEFDGDASLPIGEALDLLRYAGLSIDPIGGSNGFEVRWADSRAQIAGDLSSATDPDSLRWGALRSWQHVTLKLDAQWRSALENTKELPTLPQLRALVWAVQGEVCRIDIGADGLVATTRTQVPTAVKLDAALNVLMACAEKPDLAYDAAMGLATYAMTAKSVKLATQSVRAIAVLAKGMNAKNIELQRMSAWALGKTNAVVAVEALASAIEDAHCPAPLASAALAALVQSEKASRRLYETTLDSEDASHRQAIYQRVRIWLALPRPSDNDKPPDPEYAAANWAAAESFRVDLVLPHLRNFQSGQNSLSNDSACAAGPNWLHVPFEAGEALSMIRKADRRNILAALWRWNRVGADSPTALAVDDAESLLANSIKSILKNSSSATQRRLAIEALFRPSDARLGGEPKALCDDAGLALNVFLSDPAPAVQRSAGVILGKIAGIVHLHSLIQAELGSRPPPGTDQLLNGLVRRFWMDHAESEETSAILASFIDPLLTTEDNLVAERAAWAKMQNPGLDVGGKLRAAKAISRPSLRAIALKSIAISRMPAEVHSKLVGVFLYDVSATVREAVFSAHLPQLINHGTERTNLYALGLQDHDAAVRLAVLNSRQAIASDSRDALNERVKSLSEVDPSQEVRTAAAAWLSLHTSTFK